jgi:hypothetical protein
MMLRTAKLWIAPLAIVLLLAVVASACPTCKDGVDASDPNRQSLAAGFSYSILFMMSVPYLLLGTLGFVAYSSIKKAKAQREAEAAVCT